MAQEHHIRLHGRVTDAATGEALPYASVRVAGESLGGATDGEGHFSFVVPRLPVTLQVSYVGYATGEWQVARSDASTPLDFRLRPDGYALEEVVVKPRRERYRKRENPAVELVRQLIERRQEGDPLDHDYYSYDRYEQMFFAKDDYTPRPRKEGKPGKFDFLHEYVDTLENGVPILPVSEKEQVQTVYHRRSPRSERRLVQGYRSSGIDEIFSGDGVRQFLGEVFREVDIFRNDIPLFLQRFVSPLSTIGPNYYKYYLLDTLQIDGHPCVDLGFVPFNSETFGFTGHLYVTLDSTRFVRRARLSVPRDINLNFVSRLTIEQEFRRLADGTRICTKDDIRVHFKLTEHTKGMYARRLNVYRNHSFQPPAEATLRLFAEAAPVVTQPGAHRRTDEFWQEQRPQEAQGRDPNNTQKLMQRLNSVPLYRHTMRALSVMVNGYIPTHGEPSQSLFEFGPMNSTFNHNPLEGTRLRVGGTTTTAFSRHLFLDGYMAYGLKDGRLKYDALAEYSFNERKEFRKEYPVHSLRMEYMYDIHKWGQEYMYTSKDNMMLMLRRRQDRFISYRRQAELTYTREHYNGISYNAILRNRRDYATALTPFERVGADGMTTPVDHYGQTTLELRFRYARGEKFYQTRNTRVPITYDAWVFQVGHQMACRGLFGSDYSYHRTDIGVQKRLWLSAFGYIDLITKAGKVWSRVPWPLLILPNANMTYTIQPESYTNLNALEFINDEYLSWDVTYYMNGNLLNRLPLVKRLKWREVFCFRGLWGHLSDRNRPTPEGGEGLFRFPDCTYTMGRTPYMEAGVGVENILKFLRIDYVWRLTYRGHPDIQNRGVRMTMQLSF